MQGIADRLQGELRPRPALLLFAGTCLLGLASKHEGLLWGTVAHIACIVVMVCIRGQGIALVAAQQALASPPLCGLCLFERRGMVAGAARCSQLGPVLARWDGLTGIVGCRVYCLPCAKPAVSDTVFVVRCCRCLLVRCRLRSCRVGSDMPLSAFDVPVL
jgi:hypothetical protein